VVIDDDLGRSGSSLVERPGFRKPVASVCSGSIGAVFCIEASRLTRSGRSRPVMISTTPYINTAYVPP